MAKWKTRHCGNCGKSTQEEDQRYCTECGTELPEHGRGQRATGLWMPIQKRMVIAALIPVVGVVIARGVAENAGEPSMAGGATFAHYVGGVYAMAVLIATWELMIWTIKAIGQANGLRIPLVLAILTGWWIYGMVTITFNDSDDSPEGEIGFGKAMLSDPVLIPIEGMAREFDTELGKTEEISSRMMATALMIYLPALFSSLIVFVTVPIGWTSLAAGRARQTDWEEFRWKIRWKFW